MSNQESAENYLETILILKNKNGVVKSIDIVHELGITKPSVSVAMKNLKQKGLISVEEKGYIELTEEGVPVRGSGGHSRENAGISNEKTGEIPVRRKPKVSWVKAICPG